jgi:hypothetical protein
MAGTWTLATFAGIGYYGWNLDLGNFGQKRGTMVEIGPTIGMKPLWIFLFQQKRIERVVFTSRGNNGSVACHLEKERDSRGCGKRNSSGT